MRGWLSPWAIYDPITGKYVWECDDATPKWTFPKLNGYVPLTTSSDPYIKHVEHFQSILADAAAYIRAAEDLSAGVPITFTIDAQPDVPRNISFAFVAHAQITAFTLTIVGVDAKGDAITDTFTEADGWTFATAKAYATITSIKMTARTGTGVGDTMNVGTGSILGLANNIDAAGDVYKITKSAAAANAADYPAASYTVDVTDDTVDVSTGGAVVDGDKITIWYKSRFYTT